MENTGNKSPLEQYTDLILHLYGKKIFPSSLKDKYPDRESQPLKALQILKEELAKASRSPQTDQSSSPVETDTFQSSYPQLGKEKSTQVITEQQELEQRSITPVHTAETGSRPGLSRFNSSGQFDKTQNILTKPVATQGYKISSFIEPEERTPVSKIIELKVKQYSSLNEDEFFSDDISRLPSLERPVGESNGTAGIASTELEKTPSTLQDEESEKIDSEKLFDSALSDLSGLFDKKKKDK
ncbi:MAG: hypothetical protein ACTSP4_08440 [Candidatus Hodarchaeales archaeon]